ncbi:MAG: translation initiation factor IF-3 [Candidatus Aureabacteria bacterium]|nr:translation initiation factor IF-3 [Candidatus Auribacterota bacterium]
MVRTIDKDGKQVGIIPIDHALSLARASMLDLVEVSPNADPPVCRVMDFGKFQYQQMKKDRQGRKKQVSGKLKEIKLRPRIEIHDYNVKLRHSHDFLTKGYKVRIRLVYRGRELAHEELGRNLLKRFEMDLKDVGHVETPARTFGKNVIMLFGPLKGAKPRTGAETKKEDADAKVENKPLGGETIQADQARQG